MGYYRGDYYRGGRGDPGLLGSIFRVGKSLLTGGPIAAAKTGITEIATAVKPRTNLPMIAPTFPAPTNYVNAPAAFGTLGGVQVVGGTPGAVKTPGLGGVVSRILPGGQTGYELPMRGYHVSKSGKIVKNRHMNPLNARALRRAVRREARFVSIAKRVLHGTGYTFKRTGVPGGRKKTRR